MIVVLWSLVIIFPDFRMRLSTTLRRGCLILFLASLGLALDATSNSHFKKDQQLHQNHLGEELVVDDNDKRGLRLETTH